MSPTSELDILSSIQNEEQGGGPHGASLRQQDKSCWVMGTSAIYGPTIAAAQISLAAVMNKVKPWVLIY
ncbi:hypothetical protein K449DRAFT_439913 [Hypoxylon sp. EC38]|nr:hypothetical protein K449DRAFT_439913 [Hypoxylon sp. EC38]